MGDLLLDLRLVLLSPSLAAARRGDVVAALVMAFLVQVDLLLLLLFLLLLVARQNQVK